LHFCRQAQNHPHPLGVLFCQTFTLLGIQPWPFRLMKHVYHGCHTASSIFLPCSDVVSAYAVQISFCFCT
jgi:hypothetical protein